MPRILIIDDEKSIRNTLRDILEYEKYEIDDAADALIGIDFIKQTGYRAVKNRGRDLCAYALKKLKTVPGLRILGPTTPQNRLPIFSFSITGIHPHDIATLLDREKIAVRSGHHCAQILHNKFGLPATVRASLCFYNTREEIDRLVTALLKIKKLFDDR